uniref:C2H2-type domain-containing protein n=1 Tax=Pseudictyota dubia TaxID=2749911 RepID=A0A7R9W567_9STRA|mmetsp:Transcript_3455/g.6040  ORF Transcript_3455/g.6040 Transcript_3455/m.6040 type:complete len:470 (+) Transcript_3455:275-1684(+)|eukprot:CAMPEP_0197448100 /NCGR_PEP_ID=MMETSP1175-20131217/16200_1 /TAXON_ID=1003142 /ORGANISM="Triceratium dubium, Strain CCMP147" /LENGTH=469 /DNA_ID=CAMNT_0042979729 /DNA_START=269 /DNA_END=1678 /DNA_ORIENTATION=+
MSRQITQPVNQVRLTNVAVVRMNRHGLRFEVACYRNKIVNYRQGLETDLSEVLQTDRVFTNVSKGQFANSKDLRKAFGTTDEEEVCRIILTKGQEQISDMERSAQLESTQREVAAMVAAKCVDPSSDRPYTINRIRDAMREVGFMVHPTRSVKQQFLDCVRLLRERGTLRIERAKMELMITLTEGDGGGDDGSDEEKEEAQRKLAEAGAIIVGNDPNNNGGGTTLNQRTTIIAHIDPSLYRTIDALSRQNGWRMEILRQCVTQEGDAELGSEVRRKEDRKNREMAQEAEAAQATEEKKGTSDSEDDDEVVAGLAKRMDRSARITSSDDEEVQAEPDRAPNARKKNKKAQKKSKKARRREKEEAAEREARAEAERTRQRQRSERLGLAAGDDDANATSTAVDAESTTAASGNAAAKACNTCGGSFPTPALYRAHFRSDWHRYNVKLKMKGASSVSEREFELCDSDAFFDK